MLNIAVIAFEALAVTTVGPRIAKQFESIDLYGWMFAAFMLANLVGVVIAGHAADRYGTTMPFQLGVGLFAVGLILCGAAPSMLLFLAGRVTQGFGAGAIIATAYVTVGRAFEEHERPHQFALLSTAWIVPGLVSPAVAGLIADTIGWRFVFVGLIFLPFVAAWLSLPVMRAVSKPSRDEPNALPIAPAALVAVGSGLMLAGLTTDRAWSAISLSVVGLLMALPAFKRLTPEGTLRAQRGLPAALATRGLCTFAFFGALAFLALGLVRIRGLSAVHTGLVLTPSTLLWTCGSWVQARRAGHWTRRALIMTGTALVGTAIVGASLVLVPDVPLAIVIVIWAAAGLGMGLSYPTTTLTALSEAPMGQQGAATGSLLMTDVLGHALGTGIGGAIVALLLPRSTHREALAIVFAVMVVSAALAFLAARRLPDDPVALTLRRSS